MEQRECVKIKSDNPAFPKGYYIQFKDKMKPGDVEYFEPQTGIQIDAGDPPVEPIKKRKRR